MTYSDLRPRTKLCWSARRKRRKADSVWWAVRPSEPAMVLIRRFAFSSVISRDSRFTPRMLHHDHDHHKRRPPAVR